jgi:hypothetical protein
MRVNQMRKFLATVCALMLLATPVTAGDWSEVDISAFEKVNGEFSPNGRISIVNYISNKGIGLFVGQGNEAGPLASWRVWDRDWTGDSTFRTALHIIGSSDLLDNDVNSEVFSNGKTGFDIRWIWQGAGNIEVSTKLLWEFVEGDKAEWTPAIGLVIRPGGF